MAKTKFYKPSLKVTLFDSKLDKQIKGAMFTNTKPAALWSDKKYQLSISRYKFAWLTGLAALLLLLPLALGSSQNSKQMYGEIIEPSPTPDTINPFLVDSKLSTEFAQDFRIFIPKIYLNSDIIANVDPSSEKIYREALKAGVAHSKGSYYPGEKGLTFLFAHSTDIPERIAEYNALFFNIKDLETGDQIVVTFRTRSYIYTIYDKRVTDPFDLETIRSANADLILQTCWPPGTDLQRLMIFAKRA